MKIRDERREELGLANPYLNDLDKREVVNNNPYINDEKKKTNSKSEKNRANSYIDQQEHVYNVHYNEIDDNLDELEHEYRDLDNADDLLSSDLKYKQGESERHRVERLRNAEVALKVSRKTLTTESRMEKVYFTPFRAIRVLVVVLLTCASIYYLVKQGFDKYVINPKEDILMEELTGLYCIRNWENVLKNIDSNDISNFIHSDSWLEKEILYANSNETREEFMQAMLNTVSYTPKQVRSVDIYGNPILAEDGGVVYRDSQVVVGEEVSLTYVDYSAIEFTEELVKNLMDTDNLKLGDAGYSERLTDIVCNYVANLGDNLPLVTDYHYVPSLQMNVDGTYRMSPDEDIYIDKLLFSSGNFYDMLERFAALAGKGATNPQWFVWSNAATNLRGEEPSKTLEELPVMEDFTKWIDVHGEYTLDSKLSTEADINGSTYQSLANVAVNAPLKYEGSYEISHRWCGAYFLQNEHTSLDEYGNEYLDPIMPSLGNGKKDNPAALDTPVVTIAKVTQRDKNGVLSTTENSISVEMIEYGVSQQAIDWFEEKDVRNRGYAIDSETQYVYYVFRVTNLSYKTLTIVDNSSLCDDSLALSVRTGTVYGLQDKVTLAPGETGIIESWSNSVNLNKKYVIWGADFERDSDVVWFRKLMGDLEDTSYNKGVALNESRLGEDPNKYREGYVEETEARPEITDFTALLEGN